MPSSFDLARRRGLAALAGAALWLAGCATPAPLALPVAPAPVRAALAPTGKLRVGVYPGSPSSMVVDASGRTVGVAYELGRELARRLDVPFEPVPYRRLADVVEALKAGQVDFTFTNASPARARDIDFTATLLDVELGYLVPAGGRLSSIADVDQPVGVSEGSSSQATLSRQYRHAQLVPVPTLKAAAEALAQGRVDVFATNKGILSELADGLPGARLLAGRWGLEHMAIGVPKGRAAGQPWLNAFARDVQHDGTLQAAIARAGLRGSVAPSNS